MLSSYPVLCPHQDCSWSGNVIPSQVRGGPSAEIASKHRAWFECPQCGRNWEVQITGDCVTILTITESAGAGLVAEMLSPAAGGR